MQRGHRRRLHPTITPKARTLIYGGWEVIPEVVMVADGEPFGGTWIIRRCNFGRRTPYGYEIRCLLGDNDHFATRREATHAARLRAVRTIDLGEVTAVHLSTVPTNTADSGAG